MPVLVLAGEEDFELYRSLEVLKEKLVDPAWASISYQRLDNPPASDVIDLAAAIPFGPGNKVVVLDRIDWFAKKRSVKDEKSASSSKAAKAASKDNVDEDRLAEALSSVHPNTYLIFVATSNFDSQLRLSKLVAKHAELKEFPREKYWSGTPHPKLENWVRKEAHGFNATIDDAAVTYLIDGLEANLRHIHSELQKVATFILPQTHITLAHVTALSPHSSQIFAVLDYWLAGNYGKTLASLQELLSKQNAMGVMAAIQTFMGKWVQVKTMCEREIEKMPQPPGVQRKQIAPGELAKRLTSELKIHPFVLEKDIKRLSTVSLPFLINKRVELTRLEHLVKTGQMPDSHALELFFVGTQERKQNGRV
ncbi:MAG: hypothetical protein IPP57_15595 [Candidatus Obscuribacter sp.]|nr:hypothetical protein [Candidatus Obscuribacter sp.]